MTRHTWKITAGGLPHTVELEHGFFSGKCAISVDGQVADRTPYIWFNIDMVYHFTAGGKSCALWITTTNFVKFDYAFFAGGQHILSEQQKQMKYYPGIKVRGLLEKNDFYNNLASITGLHRQSIPKDDTQSYEVLAGDLRGYLVTVVSVLNAHGPEELLRVTVHYEPGEDDSVVFEQIEASQDFQNWQGPSKEEIPVDAVRPGSYTILFSMDETPLAKEVVKWIRDLVKIISAHRPPQHYYGCEMAECKGRPGDPVNLTILPDYSVLICDACLQQSYQQAEQNYKTQPGYLARLALTALPVILIFGLVAGALAYWIHGGIILICGLFVAYILTKLKNRLKVKFPLWSFVLAFTASLGTMLASVYSYMLFYLVFHDSWVLSPTLFAKAGQMVSYNALRIWGNLTPIIILTGLWLAGSFLPGYFRNRKRAFQPDVIVAGRLETFLDRSGR